MKNLKKSEQEQFASDAGITYGTLKQIMYGHRKPSVELSVIFENLTDGFLKCETLRPDKDFSLIRSMKNPNPQESNSTTKNSRQF